MLKVNEIFGPTIQGEGRTANKEVVFLRLSTCNLACVWCDTPYTWNWEGTKFEHPNKYSKQKEQHLMSIEQVYTKLNGIGSQVKSLVISGGEPFLQQKQLIPLLTQLKSEGWWIEVETNGTIIPEEDSINLIDQVNCSPKLANSGPDNRASMRERPEALKALAVLPKTYFKFVVVADPDIPEILALVQKYEMKQVYLMPEGRTKEEQEARQNLVQQLAQANNFEFSPRLHVLKWGNQRAV